MTQGLREAGLNVVAGVDIDRAAGATYRANHSATTTFRHLDIRDVTPSDVVDWMPQGTASQDLVLVGCSPCQYWSRVPTIRTKSKAASTLLLEFARLVEGIRPGYVVVENVPGLMKSGRIAVLRPFLSTLARHGYRAVAFDKVSSAWFGVPQQRRRFLLVASRLHDAVALPPHDRTRTPTVAEFIGRANGFAALRAGEADKHDEWHRASALSPENIRRIKMTPRDGGDRRAWRDTDLQIEAYRGRDGHFRNVYGRMWWRQPAPTLTTRFNSLSNGRFGHPDEDRALSVREGA